MTDRESRVRERAYALWERDGKPHGRSVDYWLKAERELMPEPLSKGPQARKPAARKTVAKANGKAPAAVKAAAKAKPSTPAKASI